MINEEDREKNKPINRTRVQTDWFRMDVWQGLDKQLIYGKQWGKFF